MPNPDRRRSTGHIPNHGHTGWLDGGLLAPGAVAGALGGDQGVAGGTGGGTFEGLIEELPTGETDITLVLAPDGAGGVVFRAETATGSFLTSDTGEGHDINSHGSLGATETFDLTTGNVHTGTLNADCTITLDGFSTGRRLMQVKLTEDVTGGWTPTFTCAGTLVWNGGSAPAHDTTPGTEAEYLFWSDDGGTVIKGGELGVMSEPTADAHIADTSDAHDASAISAVTSGYTNSSASNVQDVLDDFDAAITSAASTGGSSGGGSAEHAHVNDVLFSGDASTTAFDLPVAPVDAYSVQAFVAGVLTEVTLSGTLLTTATFGSAPGSGTNNVRFDIVAAVE